MNVVDAAHATVHDYPGGSVSLAPRLGIPAAVLRNKVNPNCSTHHLTLSEADRVVGLTGDLRILQAFAAEHGHGLVALGDGGAADGNTMARVLAEHSASGRLSAILHDALLDGVITPRELGEIDRAGMAVQAALVALLDHMARVVRRPAGAA